MKSIAQEAIAQVMFGTGIGSFPLSIYLAIVGVTRKTLKKAIATLFLGAIACTHFLWYFNLLGGALASKVGRYEPPAWYSFLPYSLSAFVVLIGVWSLVGRRRAEAAPPKLPNQ